MSETDPQSTDALPGDETTRRLLVYRTRRDRINRFIVNTVVVAVTTVLAVLTVLAAIVVAILGQNDAVQGSPSISCLSNVKQLCLATRMYAEDYDDHLPIATRWIDITLPYTKNEGLYRCPEVKKHPPDDYGYAMNSTVSIKRMEDIKTPEQTPLLYDTDLLYRNACAPDLMALARPGRHSAHYWDNIGYADGHAKAVRVDRKP